MASDKVLSEQDTALLQSQWDLFNDLKRVVVLENPLIKRLSQGQKELPQGTFFHGTRFNLETIQKIKDSGIISGELVGNPREDETNYCADFFRVPVDMTLPEYLDWCKMPITRGSLKTHRGEFNYLPMSGDLSWNVAFIVDTTNPLLQPLLLHDAYSPDPTMRMEGIVTELPRQLDDSPSRSTAAILVGIPSNFISGMVLSDRLTSEETSAIKTIMGDQVAMFQTPGNLI